MTTTTSNKELSLILEALTKDKYFHIAEYLQGGMSKTYLCEWGIDLSNNSNSERVISDYSNLIKNVNSKSGRKIRLAKINKDVKDIDSDSARESLEKGYNIKNEVEIGMLIPESEENNILTAIDYGVVNDNGKKYVIMVTPFFKDSIPLKDFIKKRAMNKKEFTLFSKDIFKAVNHYIANGVLHRDLNFENLLVRDKNGFLEARVADFGIACKIKDIGKNNGQRKNDFHPTAGGHWFMDPLLMVSLNDKNTEYSLQSEIYELGLNFLYALTGKIPFEYNPESGTSISRIKNNESLLTCGKIDVKKHDKSVNYALKDLPKWTKNYKPILKKMLTINEKKRYSSISDVIRDFEKAKQLNWVDKLKANAKAIGGAAASLLFAATIGIYSLNYKMQVNDDYKEKVDRFLNEVIELPIIKNIINPAYEVSSEFIWSPLEIKNNLVDIGVEVFKLHGGGIYGFGESKYGYQEPPQIINVNKGDRLEIIVNAFEKAHPRTDDRYLQWLYAKAYIEGLEPQETRVQPNGLEKETPSSDLYPGVEPARFSIPIPNYLEDGMYILTAEIFTKNDRIQQEEKDASSPVKYANIKFKDPAKVLSRIRIPIAVGNVEDKVDVSGLSIAFYNGNLRMSIPYNYEYNEEIKNKIQLELSIPEQDTTWALNPSWDRTGFYSAIFLPEPTDEENKTFQIIGKLNDKIVYRTWVPIKGEHIYKYGSNKKEIVAKWYKLAVADTSFASKIIEFNKGLK